MEEWRDIPNYEGYYQVSNLGGVRSLDRVIDTTRNRVPCKEKIKGRVLRNVVGSGGYYVVNLNVNGQKKTKGVHQLVAEAFLGHTPDGTNKLVVNHINFDKLDNRVENLEVVTNRENCNQKHLPSSSKYTGVTWHNGKCKWMTAIGIGNKQVHLGYFKDELTASKAYEEALAEYNETGSVRNAKNKYKAKTSSEYKGVHWKESANKWSASIYTKNKIIYIGLFKNENEAAVAFNNYILDNGIDKKLNTIRDE